MDYSQRKTAQEQRKVASKTEIGLMSIRKDYTIIKAALSQSFNDYLGSLKNWFENLENFRHALAHRIPLYIPPFILTADDEKIFRPLMRHSFSEEFREVPFREQILKDWKNIIEIATRFRNELK